MKKTLLAAAAAIATIASASAQTMDGQSTANNNSGGEAFFECVITKVTPADKDPDPSYKVNISIHADGSFDTVVHTARSGATYDRVKQYTNLETGLDKQSGWPMWAGRLKSNRTQTIVGSFFTEGKQKKAHYLEFIFGKDPKKIRTVIDSDCHPIQA